VTKRSKANPFIRVAAVCVVVVAAFAARDPREVCREWKVSNGRQFSFGPVAELGPQASPDGKLLAFEYFPTDRPNIPQIWLMERSEGFRTARPLVDNPNYNAEFSWSPDGQWISYISHSLSDRPVTSQIFKVKVSDGTTRQLTNFGKGKTLGDSTSWSKDGLIAFENDEDIYVVRESGGEAKKFIDVGSKVPSLSPSEIRWSPDGSRLAFTGKTGHDGSRIWIANVKNHTISPVTAAKWDSTPSWYDKNHILFSHGIPQGYAVACVLCLDTRSIKCLTKGGFDFSPWGDARTHELFVAHAPKSSTEKQPKAFFAGFHLWRFQLPN